MSRILVLTPWDRMWSLAGGGAPSWAYLIEGLLESGHRVDVLAAPGETEDYPHHPLLRVRRMAAIKTTGQVLRRERTWVERTRHLLAAASASRREFGRPDLVYGFSAMAIPAAAISASLWRRPSVGKLFGTFLLPSVGHVRRLVGGWDEALGFCAPVTRLVVHDDGTGGDVVARWLRVPPARLRFWRNGVDRDACDAARRSVDHLSLRAEIGLAARTPLIYTASRLASWKRLDRIIRAMPELLAQHPEARLVIAGEGEEREALERLARELDLAGAVIFAGAVARERNLRLMAAADVFCATYDYSNIGNALQEAMSCAAPVIVTDTGRTRELVADGVSGLVVPPDDTSRLAQAMASVLGDERLRERLGAGALHAATSLLPSRDERIGWEVAMVEELIAESSSRASR
jgi:glycosyltransferase involved in cell wall biosynthesis